MIPIPNRKTLTYLTLGLALLVVGYFYPPFLIVGILFDAGFLVFCVIDILQSIQQSEVITQLDTVRIFSIGRKNHLSCRVINNSPFPIDLQLRLHIPDYWDDLSQESGEVIGAQTSVDREFILRPIRRGVYTIPFLYIRFKTQSGLFHIYEKRKVDYECEVYPDVKELNQYLLMARRNRLAEMGIHKTRMKGMGTELEYLKEYQQDDDAKNIEWKVSTRINKPVTKVFQMESRNHITLVLDCGRQMTSEQDDLNSLDYAVNGLLILAHVAHSMGDSLQIIAFSDTIIGELPPTKGKNMVRKAVKFATALRPSYVESNYKLVFEYIRRKVKRRSLIIFFSDLLDDMNYDLFRKYVPIINKRHLTLFLMLRDVLLENQSKMEADSTEDYYTTIAAREMKMSRHNTIRKLQLQGVRMLDILPNQVTPRLVDSYLELKARNAL